MYAQRFDGQRLELELGAVDCARAGILKDRWQHVLLAVWAFTSHLDVVVIVVKTREDAQSIPEQAALDAQFVSIDRL